MGRPSWRAPRTRRGLVAAAAAVLATLLVLSVTALSGSGGQASGALAVPAYAGTVPCRSDTLAHVHHPTRLEVVAPCATLHGTVGSVSWQPTDGDWVVELALDGTDGRVVPDPSQPVDVRLIPADVAAVTLPRTGERVAASGAWVRNRNAAGRLQLHPTWELRQVDGPLLPAGPTEPSVDVAVALSETVRVGQALPVGVTVTRRGVDSPQPVPLAHLWLEVAPADGEPVGWAAQATNALGAATMDVVALYRPGRYRAALYVEVEGKVAVLQRTFQVVP